MQRIIRLMVLLCLPLAQSPAQVITFEPEIPTVNQALTVYFDASKGNEGLKGYTGEVYAHTGVLTDYSNSTSDWKFVKTDWGQNTPETKLTRISDDYYKLEITPDVISYYGFPSSVEVTHVALVFRSGEKKPGSSDYYEGKDEGGKDIFIELFKEGLNVSIIEPEKASLVVDLNDTIQLRARASSADSLNLYLNDQYVMGGDNPDSISYMLIADSYGDNLLRVNAFGDGETASDSLFYYVRKPIEEKELPVGVIEGINYTSDTSAVFVLYAPRKQSAFLLSDVTGWNATEKGAMYRTPDSARYWINIGGLDAGKEYPFQYLVDGSIRIADPYADKYLDPWNDKYIEEETYPDLLPYPTGKTEQMVSVFQTAQTDYHWTNTEYTVPEKTRLIVYELLLRDFLAAHDFRTLTDTLDYLDRLGVNAIELMPFNEFDGNISWGYNPAFYFAPDKYYGPKNTLKAFVDSCHGRGIAVIQDMVLNHSYGQHSLVRLYLDEKTGKVSEDNPWYNVTSPNPVFGWGYDFDHESQATKDFMDRVNGYWMNEYKIDGFRFDFTKGFTNKPGDGGAYDASRIKILKRMADTIWKINPKAYVILEHFAANTEEEVLSDYGMLIWGNMNHEYAEATMGYPSSLNGTTNRSRGWKDPHVMAYMESHDEERIQYKVRVWGDSEGDYDTKTYENRMERMGLSTVFFLSIPGPKMIWQFGEMGYSFSIGEETRTDPKPIHWEMLEDTRRKRLFQIYQGMLQLREDHPVFHTADYDYNLWSAQKRVNLNHADLNITLIGNFGISDATIEPAFQHTGTWYDYFNGTSIEVSDVNAEISLGPGEYHLYSDKLLEDPGIISSIREPLNPGISASIYPNPAPGKVHIELAGTTGEARLELFDAKGRKIRESIACAGEIISIDQDNPGLYYLRITGADFVINRKIYFTSSR